jgi:hypothetical protein
MNRINEEERFLIVFKLALPKKLREAIYKSPYLRVIGFGVVKANRIRIITDYLTID